MTAVSSFDIERLRDLVGPDETRTLVALLRTFAGQVPATWQALARAITVGDAAAAGRHAHHLKGSVTLVGAAPLAAILDVWERGDAYRVERADVDRADALVRALLADVDRFLEQHAAAASHE